MAEREKFYPILHIWTIELRINKVESEEVLNSWVQINFQDIEYWWIWEKMDFMGFSFVANFIVIFILEEIVILEIRKDE